MKIGGTGLIGSKTVTILPRGGHEVVAASRKGGVNTVTREGLKEAIDGTQVVIEVSNEACSVPYTIFRSTQFLEFLGSITNASADGSVLKVPLGLLQPIAADDVADILAEVAYANPRNGIIEIAGPERGPFNQIIARYLEAVGDSRKVVSDPNARYFGGRLEEESLVPLGEARLGRLSLDEWLCSRVRQGRPPAGTSNLPVSVPSACSAGRTCRLWM